MSRSESDDSPELGSMKDGPAPPDSLEEKTVNTLKSRGLIRGAPPGRWPAPSLAFAGMAAALAVFLLGLAVGRTLQPSFASEPQNRTFAMLLREPPGWPDELDTPRLVAEYRSWAHSQGEMGRLVGGEKLDVAGRWIRRASNEIETTPVPVAAEQSLPIGGYFMVTADDYEGAVAIAKTCPHLKYGGTIEVRAIDN